MNLKSLMLVCALVALASPVQAIVPKEDDPDPRHLGRDRADVVAERIEPGAPGVAGLAAGQFLAVRGGDWEFRVDARTGKAVLVQGSGIAVVPGKGNRLGTEALAGLDLPDGEIVVETLAPGARAFIEQHWELLGPLDGRLELDRETSSVRNDGRLASIYFRWFIGDVPVEDARVFVRVNNGNITQFGAPLIGRADVDPVPTVGRDDAIAAVLDWANHDQETDFSEEPRLVIQPENDGGDVDYRLVWVATYSVPERIETWEGRIDAHTGEVISFEDVNRYGRAEGAVYPRTVIDDEVRAPMPFSNIQGDATVTTDVAGFFSYGGEKISSGLDGPYFTTNCSGGCSDPSQATLSVGVGIGRVDFGFGGLDEVGNGLSTKAERNAFYHLNQVRRIAKKWLDNTWLDSNIGINVNIDNTCNAVWTGAANFYRSGGGCNNTGEISDVMYHEWGHGLDGNTRGGDGATGEGTADVVSMHVTHSPLIGPYFRVNGNPVRNIDPNGPRGPLTTSNVNSVCQSGSGPLGAEVHCEGEIYGQTSWELAQALVAKHGHHTGWRTSERIFFTALPDSGSYLSTGSFPIYDAYIAAADDNGDVTDGVPDGDEIFAAFSAHGIAGTPRASSPPCARPTQPTLSVTPQCDRFDLSWDAVTGVDHYEIFRAEILPDSALHKVADVAAGQTTHVDTLVAPAIDYHYVVMAVNPDGCESTVENPVTSRLIAQPILSVTAATATDEPAGNRSGFADPGEDVDLVVTLGNFGELDGFSISGMITSPTAGVTFLDGSDTWPTLAPGGEGANENVLRFSTDEAQLACGDTVRFELVPDEASGCAAQTSFFEVILGDREIEFRDDFEGDQGWTVDIDASTATAGAWTRGDPDGTGFQPEDDINDPGTQCWFTAPNPNGIGGDDVDNGVTVLLSPVFDLTSLDQAVLSYWRWFANRDLGEDVEDFFRAQVTDGVGGWVDLENLGTNDSAPAWTRREFDLTEIITLTDQVQLRFMVSDGPATGNLIEAALDDVRIDRPLCDDTPACFTEPTFAGASAGLPGGSCGETQLTWADATSNCINATVTYNVYRSTDPGFVPDASNLIASGLTGTSFDDTLLAPDVAYHYLVRAFDSRSGEDSNLERVTIVSPASPDLQAPIFAGLEGVAGGAGCGEVALSWSAAVETCNLPVVYQVFRSTDPGFVPDAGNLVGATTALGFVDAATTPGTTFTYVVRAADDMGNIDTNDVRFTSTSTNLDLTLVETGFEPNAAGWKVVDPNDAVTGNWEWGVPVDTGTQPGTDHTPDPGVNAWITGLSDTAPGADNNDVDDGSTTLLSSRYDITGAVDPAVRYARWYTNDTGGNPGEDPFVIEVSNDDGGTWNLLEEVGGGTPLEWVVVEIPLTGITTPTAEMLFRFSAADLGVGGSLVEAGVDDFAVVDRNQGCLGCTVPAQTVGNILVSKSGDDVVIDWTADPINGTRYVVHQLIGPDFGEAIDIGSTTSKSFVHEGAALSDADFNYRVTAIDACGNESPLQ